MCEVAEKIYDQGEMEKAKKMAISLHESGAAEDIIAKTAIVSIEIVKKWLGLSLVCLLI